MAKGKKIYFSILLLITFLASTLYFSYAFFTSINEEHGKLNIVAGDLTYKIESSELVNDKIIIPTNSLQEITLKLYSLNSIDSKYELYYKVAEEEANVQLGYSTNTSSPVKGIIEADSVKEVTLIIRNDDTEVIIEIGVEGGLINNELVLTKGNSLDKELQKDDIILAYTYVGDGDSPTSFPNKGEGYNIDSVSCTGADGEWNSNTWSLSLTNITTKNISCNATISAIPELTTYTFSYIGSSQTFIVPQTGNYKIELWGAGSTKTAGYGGYTSGEINLTAGTELYVYVGEGGKDGRYGITETTPGVGAKATFNGGGAGGNGGGGTDYPYNNYTGGPSGSGATDIRLVNGSWDNFDSLKSRVMVAGGAGGIGRDGTSYLYESPTFGDGGGLTAYNGNTSSYALDKQGIGGSQYKGNAFGIGGEGADMSSYYVCHGHAGGGGGYYGGTGGLSSFGQCYINGGGGGSSFISGHYGCISITESSTSTNIILAKNSNHYSGYIFTNTVMIDGAGFSWTGVKGKYTEMPTYDSLDTMVGNSGNGYAKITYLDS